MQMQEQLLSDYPQIRYHKAATATATPLQNRICTDYLRGALECNLQSKQRPNGVRIFIFFLPFLLATNEMQSKCRRISPRLCSAPLCAFVLRLLFNLFTLAKMPHPINISPGRKCISERVPCLIL